MARSGANVNNLGSFDFTAPTADPEAHARFLKGLLAKHSPFVNDNYNKPLLVENRYYVLDHGDRARIEAHVKELEGQIAEERRWDAAARGADINEYDMYVRVDGSSVLGVLPPLRNTPADHMGIGRVKDYEGSGWLSMFRYEGDARTVLQALPTGSSMHFIFMPKTVPTTALTFESSQRGHGDGLYSTAFENKVGVVREDGRYVPDPYAQVFKHEHLFAGRYPNELFSHTTSYKDGRKRLLEGRGLASFTLFEHVLQPLREKIRRRDREREEERQEALDYQSLGNLVHEERLSGQDIDEDDDLGDIDYPEEESEREDRSDQEDGSDQEDEYDLRDDDDDDGSIEDSSSSLSAQALGALAAHPAAPPTNKRKEGPEASSDGRANKRSATERGPASPGSDDRGHHNLMRFPTPTRGSTQQSGHERRTTFGHNSKHNK